MEKKYELTGETKVLESGKVLHRIRALRDFSSVSAGELGGFISDEHNLSHDGNCWIYKHAIACDDAAVRDNAKLYNHVIVSDHATVCNNTRVYGKVRVCEHALVCDYARVSNNVLLHGYAVVTGDAIVNDNAIIHGYAVISNDTIVSGNADISGDVVLVRMSVRGNACLKSMDDILFVKGLGSAHRGTTMYKTKDGGVEVICGCFHGSLDEFENKVVLTHGDSKFAREYLAFAEVAKIYFGLK